MNANKPFPRTKLACGIFSLADVVSGRGYVANIGHSFVDYSLTDKEIQNLRELLCKGTHSQTYSAFDRHASSGFRDLPCLSLLDRVQYRGESRGWVLVAAQDYNCDMAGIRKIFRDN